MNVTFRQLRVFTEVARHGSVLRAAESLHLTSPAVSMQIKELEGQVGLPLFDRHNRRISLSTSGEYFLVYVRRLLATLKEAEDAMARFTRVETGVLNIGLVSTAKYFVPRLLVKFRQEHPGVDIRLHVCANREQLVRLLEANEADLAIMGRPPREMATRSEPFAAHPHVFVAPPGHAILRVGHPPVATVAQQPLIVREPASGTRALMDRFFADHRAEANISMEMPSNETIKQAVMAGMGLGFLSLHTLGLELQAGALEIVHVEDTPVVRTWNVVNMSARLLSPAAEKFRYFVLEEGERFLAAQDRAYLPVAPEAPEAPATPKPVKPRAGRLSPAPTPAPRLRKPPLPRAK